VIRVDIFARSIQSPVPGSMDIFESVDKTDNAKKGTLVKDTALGNLLHGPLTTGLPTKPDGEWKLFSTVNTISDLWIAITWSE